MQVIDPILLSGGADQASFSNVTWVVTCKRKKREDLAAGGEQTQSSESKGGERDGKGRRPHSGNLLLD